MKDGKSEFKPGQPVYLRTHGGGPFVLIQHVDQMVVNAYRPDPHSKKKDHWLASKHSIDDTWIVRTKDDNYLHYPTAALTRREPLEAPSTLAPMLMLLGAAAILTAPVTVPLMGYLGLF